MSERPDKPQVSSSTAPQFAEKQEMLFRETLERLNECQIPYVVAGAFALHLHTGIWRWTKDLDLFLTAEDVGGALRCLAETGFECEIRDPVWLAKAHRDGFYVDLITGMSNAVITVEPSWIAHAVAAEVMGVRTRVLAAEELLASKLFVTRRERFDGADIAHLIYGTRGEFNWERVLALAGEHWEVLLWTLVLYRYVYPAHTDYVPRHVWKELLDRFQLALANPDPSAHFRGSLIDDYMFAIDVAEWGMENVLDKQRVQRQANIRCVDKAS
jgi:hypothetical protein